MGFLNISIEDIALYLKLDFSTMSDEEKAELQVILDSANSFIINETGLETTELDSFADIIMAVYVLCQHQYDNRSYVIEKSSINPLIQSILSLHSKNYL